MSSTAATTAGEAPAPASRGARRRFITRRLLSPLGDAGDPRVQLFHFEQEMADQFAKNRLSSSMVIPALILAMGVAASLVGDPVVALIWGVGTLAAHFLVIRTCRRFLAAEHEQSSLPVWKHRFIARDLIYGLAWGAFPLLFGQGPVLEELPVLDIIRFAAVIVVLSVHALLSSPIPAAAVAGTLPIALSMAAVHLIDPSLPNLLIALCTLATEIFFLYLASHLFQQHQKNLAYRAEKDAIFAELEQAKAVSDEARRRAEAANMAKSQFLATMSHELRTPLNAIVGFSEVMRDEMLGPIDNASYKDYLNDIHSSGQHLLKLINEVLDLSRIEAGKRELKEELTSLVAIAEEARGLMEFKSRQKNIRITELYDEALPKIVLDEQALRQVVLNILSNAMKFTPAGGEIVIKVGRTQAGGQYVSIRDNGPGIPENELPIVLSAFGQGSISLKTAEQGTGLGIAIVQALVHLHDGNFTLRSQVGVGTEAIVTLPAKRVVSAFTDDHRTWALMQARKPARLKKAS
jgi:two-component system, cell cycle sensor histidine kinase PleC